MVGFAVIGYVLWNAEAAAKIGGVVWLVIGVGVMLYYRAKGGEILPEHAFGETTAEAERRAGMTEHLITRDQAHAGYDADVRAGPRVSPGAGDRIVFETDDAAYAQMEEHRDLAQVTATLNPVTGPVFVEGAEPGDAARRARSTTSRLAEHGWSVYIPGAGALTAADGGASSSSAGSPSSTASSISPTR